MADPHNPKRYGETWPKQRLLAYLEVATALKQSVVFSGGWAWHFLSPEGHTEYKHAHDHKDLDLMVPPRVVGQTVSLLKCLGFKKVKTKYDRLGSEEDFRRYEKLSPWFECQSCTWTGAGSLDLEWYGAGFCPDCEELTKDLSFRLTIDFFVKDVPTTQCEGGWLVVRPDVLLTYYKTIHSSKSCWAVLAATQLFANGAKPHDLVSDPCLMVCADLDTWYCTKCQWWGQFPLKQGHLTVCGGCERYAVHNQGKPTFTPRPERMEKVREVMEREFDKA